MVTEGLVDREICLDNENGSSDDLALFKHVTSSSVENTIDTTHSNLGTLGGGRGRERGEIGSGKEGGRERINGRDK